MRVLLVNNHYRAGGGAETVVFQTQRLLESAGHEVVPFSLLEDETLPTRWSGDFPEAARLARNAARRKPSLATIYSFGVRRTLARLVDRIHPDVAHLHNVYEKLTLSVIDALRGRRVPIVLTLHDYRAVCPNGYLLAPDGPCLRCVRARSFGSAIALRCLGSVADSAVAAAECYLNQARGQYAKADVLLAPSRFLRNAMVAGGLPRSRLRIVRNPVSCRPFLDRKLPSPPRFVFFGRLVEQKGVDVLFDAASMLSHGATIAVYGTGRYERHLRERLRRERLPVELKGRAARAVIARDLESATAAVVPSLWYENCPMAIAEAAACGVATIGSDLGSIREMIDDRRDGVLVPPGDPAALAYAMNELALDPQVSLDLGSAAWRRARNRYSPRGYVRRLLGAYADANGG